MDGDRFGDDLRAVDSKAEGSCLSACCALSIHVLFGEDELGARSAILGAFGAIEGGATFANAKVLLARLFSVRADVVSGPLAEICRLNGIAGLVILGIDPSLVYAGAMPGRHAVLLASCITERLPVWAPGFLDAVCAGPPDPVTFVDLSGPVAKQATSFSKLTAAFDRAGREALLVEHGRP